MTTPRLSTIRQRSAGAFTLVEVLMGLSIMGVMFVSLYSGISYGYALTNNTRQDERATQILAERMEIVRLLSWDQITNTSGYLPQAFADTYYANNVTNTPSGPVIYSGTVTVTLPATGETYSNDLRQIQIAVTWTTGALTHRRQMSTVVSPYGLQKYMY